MQEKYTAFSLMTVIRKSYQREYPRGFAVRWFCDYLGIPIENSVAAGDAQNDVEMLKAAHVGAVMCNAFPGIAEYGNYVTEHDNNHDGVAEIIHKFILKDA